MVGEKSSGALGEGVAGYGDYSVGALSFCRAPQSVGV